MHENKYQAQFYSNELSNPKEIYKFLDYETYED